MYAAVQKALKVSFNCTTKTLFRLQEVENSYWQSVKRNYILNHVQNYAEKFFSCKETWCACQ